MRARLRKGFTLVEVIIVLIIVGIAAVIAVPGISGYISHTSERACEKMMSSTMDDISRAVTVKKFPSNAAVSIAIYKEINKLPMLRLRCPQSVSDADESEIEKLENGPLTGDTLEVAISPIKSTVEGETYSVGWSFADDYVTVSMECSSHDSISMKQKLRIYYGGDISGIISPPEVNELKKMYNACAELLEMTGDNGEPLFQADDQGNVGGDMKEAAERLSEFSGLEVTSIRKFRLSGGKPFLLHVLIEGRDSMEIYNFSSIISDSTSEA